MSSKESELNLVLLGGPGAGKGTQAEKLVDERDMNHLATGDILREEVGKETDLGQKAKEYMDRGDLVPDELVVNMVKKRLDQDKGYLFDGFPRTIEQAEELESVLDLDMVLYIKIDKDEAVRRLSARRVCSDCGKIYNKNFKKPDQEGVCDKCGGELYQRDDDKPEVIRDRFETFLDETSPLIDYYSEKDLLAEVNGEQGPDQVYEEIEEYLGELNFR